MILDELPPYERILAHHRMFGFGWTELAGDFGTNVDVLRKRFPRATSRAVARLN